MSEDFKTFSINELNLAHDTFDVLVIIIIMLF